MQANNILSYYTEIQQLIKNKMCYPRFADLHMSNICNQDCKGCAYKHKLNNKIIAKEDYLKIVNTLMDFGIKAFDIAGGGEPLMIPYIKDILNYIIYYNCYYGIITNGTLLNDELIEQIIRQASYIRISLEASCKDDYCIYKGVNSKQWHNVLSNILKLTDMKRKLKSNCEIGIKFSVGKSFNNELHYLQGVLLGINLNVDNIQFKAFRHEPEELTLDEKIQEDKICEGVFNKTETNIKLRKWIVPSDSVPQCWLNPLHIVVDYSGDVYLCCYYYYRYDNHRIGNMLQTSLKELWFNKKHQDMIKQIKKEECAYVDCKFFAHHKNIEYYLKGGWHEFL